MAEQLHAPDDKAGHGLHFPASQHQQQQCLDLTDLQEDSPPLASAGVYDLIDLDQALPPFVSSAVEDDLIDLDEAFRIPIDSTPRPLPLLPVAHSESSTSRHFDNIPDYRSRHLPPLPVNKPAEEKPVKMVYPNIPKPGPAKLSPNAGLEEWLEEAKQCHFLPEHAMKQLCELVKECLMEGRLIASFSFHVSN